MSDKPKFPRAAAIAVARELCTALLPACHQGRIVVAGSLRRRKQEVGDVEILFIPTTKITPIDLFATYQQPDTDAIFDSLLKRGIIVKRQTATGSEVWGEKNKLARHHASGIPVDFFTATESNYVNYGVCRTGSAENNIRIAAAAKAKGWQWHPYGSGFTDDQGRPVRVTTERDVFDFVGLEYKEPWER